MNAVILLALAGGGLAEAVAFAQNDPDLVWRARATWVVPAPAPEEFNPFVPEAERKAPAVERKRPAVGPLVLLAEADSADALRGDPRARQYKVRDYLTGEARPPAAVAGGKPLAL